MAKDMYQKRRERKEKRENNINNDEGFQKTVINWDISTDAKPHSNSYEIRKFEK